MRLLRTNKRQSFHSENPNISRALHQELGTKTKYISCSARLRKPNIPIFLLSQYKNRNLTLSWSSGGTCGVVRAVVSVQIGFNGPHGPSLAFPVLPEKTGPLPLQILIS
jgi:hypothetical protein